MRNIFGILLYAVVIGPCDDHVYHMEKIVFYGSLGLMAAYCMFWLLFIASMPFFGFFKFLLLVGGITIFGLIANIGYQQMKNNEKDNYDDIKY